MELTLYQEAFKLNKRHGYFSSKYSILKGCLFTISPQDIGPK